MVRPNVYIEQCPDGYWVVTSGYPGQEDWQQAYFDNADEAIAYKEMVVWETGADDAGLLDEYGECWI